MKNLKLLGVLLVSFMVLGLNVFAESCTENCVAQVGTKKYTTVLEAINAVQDGGTVELLASEISEVISTGRITKSFSIVGAPNHATTLTGGLTIGTDVSSKPVDQYTVTIKGIVFKNKGIAVKDIKNVYIEDNKLDNVPKEAGDAAILVLDSGIHGVEGNVIVKNNIINDAYQGIRIRNGYNMEIKGNVVKNTDHNSITIEHGSKWPGNNGTVIINNNTLENWALGAKGEGRAVRASFGSATQLEKEVSFTGNKMIRDEEPVEEYAKLTGVGTVAVDFEKNYWNSAAPDFGKIILVEGGNETVEIAEYYKAETMLDKDLNTYVEPPKVEIKEVDTKEEVKEVTIGVADAKTTEEVLLKSLEADKELSEKVEGTPVKLEVEIAPVKPETIKEDIKTSMAEKAGKAKIATYFDITVAIKNAVTNAHIDNIPELTKEIELVVLLPEDLRNTDAKVNRTYYVIREHDGKVEKLPATLSEDGKSLTFKSKYFSTYALAYEDSAKVTEKVPQTADGITTAIVVGTLAIVSAAGICLYLKKEMFN